MATEVMSFGTVLSLFRACPRQTKGDVANLFAVPDAVLDSWLLTLNTIRNVCAHHSRLWNRVLGVVPKIPREPDYPDWHRPVRIDGRRIFSVLTICRYALRRIAPQSAWPNRFSALLAQYPNIPIGSMGFPVNWEECPIWES
jgi:abortive infection bacteriophage resistance protein